VRSSPWVPEAPGRELGGCSRQQAEARDRIAEHWDKFQAHPFFDTEGECKVIGATVRPRSIREVREAVARLQDFANRERLRQQASSPATGAGGRVQTTPLSTARPPSTPETGRGLTPVWDRPPRAGAGTTSEYHVALQFRRIQQQQQQQERQEQQQQGAHTGDMWPSSADSSSAMQRGYNE